MFVYVLQVQGLVMIKTTLVTDLAVNLFGLPKRLGKLAIFLFKNIFLTND